MTDILSQEAERQRALAEQAARAGVPPGWIKTDTGLTIPNSAMNKNLSQTNKTHSKQVWNLSSYK